MTTFSIRRASRFRDEAPVEGAVAHNGERGTYYTIEIDDILQFCREHGSIILSLSNEDSVMHDGVMIPDVEFNVRIYDGYVE